MEKIKSFCEKRNEIFTDWCSSKVDKWKKAIGNTYKYYFVISLILLLTIYFVSYTFVIVNSKDLLSLKFITTYTIFSIIYIYPSIYFYFYFEDLSIKFSKTYLFLYIGQLLEIYFTIILILKIIIEYRGDRIDYNCIIYFVVTFLLFRFTQLLLYYYVYCKESRFDFKKWIKRYYEGYGFKLRRIKNDLICNDIIHKNHYKIQYIEKMILNKFKTKENIVREKFLISKKEFILENLTLISIIPTIIGLIFSFYKFILSNIEKKNLQIYFSYESVSILYLCGIFIVLFSIISYIDYKNKKSYLYILDYIIENYDALSEKYNIKRLCIRDEFFNKYYLTTIFIEYSNKLIQQEELKDTIKFLEENGIQIIFCSNEIERKDIEKCLKNYNLFSYDYTILDKKEIEKIKIEKNMKDTGVDNEFYQILSEKLGISTNEKFIIGESEEKIKLRFVDFEDKYFCNFSEVLKFLQSKME